MAVYSHQYCESPGQFIRFFFITQEFRFFPSTHKIFFLGSACFYLKNLLFVFYFLCEGNTMNIYKYIYRMNYIIYFNIALCASYLVNKLNSRFFYNDEKCFVLNVIRLFLSNYGFYPDYIFYLHALHFFFLVFTIRISFRLKVKIVKTCAVFIYRY